MNNPETATIDDIDLIKELSRIPNSDLKPLYDKSCIDFYRQEVGLIERGIEEKRYTEAYEKIEGIVGELRMIIAQSSEIIVNNQEATKNEFEEYGEREQTLAQKRIKNANNRIEKAGPIKEKFETVMSIMKDKYEEVRQYSANTD